MDYQPVQLLGFSDDDEVMIKWDNISDKTDDRIKPSDVSY